MMNKRNERMEKMVNAGIETGKYFTFELPEGLEPGTKLHVVIDESGAPQVKPVMETDPVYKDIIEDGYVRNTKLHRRWVMAQMFRMLNYKSWDKTRVGYNEALKNYGYDYTFKMMLEEVKVLSKLEARDFESFRERSHFFTKDVVVAVCKDYLEKLKKHVDKLTTKNCKGVPYKTVKGEHIFVEDLNKKLYWPLQYKINDVVRAENYTEMYRALQRFMKDMVKLPWTTPKSKEWIDAYKGEGAFYTCKNLIMFHNCKVQADSMVRPFYTRDESMNILNVKLNEYKGEGWRMFAFMKKLIADNNFDFNARMKEIYNK